MLDRKARQQRAEIAAAQAMVSQMLLMVSEMVEPMREWLTGQETYFLSQAYTADEARAMAAATYVTVFGSSINRTPPPPDEKEEDPRNPS